MPRLTKPHYLTSKPVIKRLYLASLWSVVIVSAPLYATQITPLPQAVSNNAVAMVHSDEQTYLLSFMGLGKGKDYQDVHNLAWALPINSPAAQWQSIKAVPHVAPLSGRLAAIAVGIKEHAYVFGGYTVAENHDEISTVDNYQYSISTNSYQRIADMPVAVDDTTAATYQQRYIYLFGGWHNDGNVNLVQVYDTQTDSWAQASPIPAPAVFGQAVGLVDNQLVLCDGVKVQANINARRSYKASAVCLFGEINSNNHLRIDWQLLPHYSIANLPVGQSASQPNAATAHYRMAATGIMTPKGGQIVFLGGSDNPYNYSGIGYNGQPSEPGNYQYRFDLASKQWLAPQALSQPSMDHRGLLCWQHTLLRVGGMLSQQQVSDEILSVPLNNDETCR
ncbi:Kelch repeat-containing protein [Shewanella algicola]|uniref:Kelch repeat-containing protein n=1 Tax=Shewanella algicola TaxID=640633 RepID=UPI002494D867|nr:kelch repeat-containing protein [Shewanella algicola]